MLAANVCKLCESEAFLQETEYGSLVCGSCGCENFTHILNPAIRSSYCVPLYNAVTYTRLKRFRKYLQRSSMSQSKTSIPPGTWDYLLKGSPYRGPSNIVRRLKKAPKHIRKKCYDSLPYLTAALCPNVHVPCISEAEKNRALHMFNRIDRNIKSGPFVSYLYCLEFILQRMQRRDICAHINCIQCPKRRATYKLRLDKIFGTSEKIGVQDLLRRNAVDPPESL